MRLVLRNCQYAPSDGSQIERTRLLMGHDNDGGYYAIKGFLYQFDKTLIEILGNPDATVMVEHREDIDFQGFVIQVKHKETQDYKDHKIRKPVIQLIELFKTDQSQKFCLYCHFRDRKPDKWFPALDELDGILGNQKDNYTPYLKGKFIDSFCIQFSEDFESQFLRLIDLIQKSFALHEEDRAFLYHSLFRSKLLDLSLKAKDKRSISRADLERFAKGAEKTIFYRVYSKFLDGKRYERLIKSEYFTFKAVNLDNFERLFIIDCDEQVSQVDLSKIANQISTKYFRVGKSPQPFLCFMNLEDKKLKELKRDLVDQGIMFNDGTCFDGDRFRLDRIIEKALNSETIRIKIIGEDNVERLLLKLRTQEIFQFYLESPLDLKAAGNHLKIQIAETSQIMRIL